jgi:hypothetical protein
VLIIQHIWSQWTKAARGANAPLKRPRLDEAYRLPPFDGAAEVLRHEVRAREHEDFAIVERIGPISRDDWKRPMPYYDNALDWRLRKGGAEIMLSNPSEHRLQTKWPGHLPSPLFVLCPGETARIDWNGRLRMSMGGSNLSTYYEQHIYWLALAEAPEPLLFLDAEPRKHIDLRTGIY